MHEATKMAPLETGGVLMGYFKGVDVVITDWIGAGPSARHEGASFEPDYDFQEREIAKIYQASGRVTTYVGDWHSHPEGGLALSRTDRGTLKRIANHPAARARQPLMMILAGRAPWRLGIWSWQPTFLRFLGTTYRLEPRAFQAGSQLN